MYMFATADHTAPQQYALLLLLLLLLVFHKFAEFFGATNAGYGSSISSSATASSTVLVQSIL
jgi:hypothetical protein